MTPVGTLADFVDVAGEHEAVADDFLRDELNYIVVKSWQDAEKGSGCCARGWMGGLRFSCIPMMRRRSCLRQR
jgi:chromosome segregation protein